MSETLASEDGGDRARVGTASPVALVTGAASGIGRAIAARLAADGWQVVCIDRDEAALLETAAALGPEAHALTADVGDPESVARAVDVARVHYKRLDAVVCNAGIMVRKPIASLSVEEFRHVLDVNLTSTFLFAQAAAPLLAETRGSIVTIASTRAHMSEPDTESYAAAKGGLVALTHALAVSLGPEVRANAVSPGWIDVAGAPLSADDHAQHPVGRVGRPEDVASLVAWLVGPQSGFVTGAEFVVDGGMTRRMIYRD